MGETVQEKDGSGDGEGREGERTLAVEDEIHEGDEVVAVDPEPEFEHPPVPVRVLHRDGLSVLVQWTADDGATGRAVIPVDEVAGGHASPLALNAGIPGGEPWADQNGVSKSLEQAFYRRGIWEPEDMLRLSHLARQAIQRELVVPLMKQLLEYSKRVARNR